MTWPARQARRARARAVGYPAHRLLAFLHAEPRPLPTVGGMRPARPPGTGQAHGGAGLQSGVLRLHLRSSIGEGPGGRATGSERPFVDGRHLQQVRSSPRSERSPPLRRRGGGGAGRSRPARRKHRLVRHGHRRQRGRKLDRSQRHWRCPARLRQRWKRPTRPVAPAPKTTSSWTVQPFSALPSRWCRPW